jgi:hypothetical protein
MAEFLIKAQGNKWMEALAKESWTTKKLTQEQFDARGEIGDLVQVVKDGQTYWFNDPPQHILIRVPELDYDKSKSTYEKGLYETKIEIVDGKEVERGVMRKKRKYFVSPEVVDEAIKNKGELKMTPEEFEKIIQERILDNVKAITTQAVSLSAVMKV